MTTEGRKPANLVRLTWPALGCAACLVPFVLSAHGWWPQNRVVDVVGGVVTYAFLVFAPVSLVYVVVSLRAPLPILRRLTCALLNLVYPWALAVYLLLP
jgi:hypothetical protein